MTTTDPPLIDCRAIRRTYTRGSSSRFSRHQTTPVVTALDGVDLEIMRGEIVGLAGPSGSGKSTLLHLIAGLDTPTSGTIQFDGTDLAALSSRRRTRHRLRNVGIVFQHFHLLDALSARQNVALPLVELGVSKTERRQRADELLSAIGLGDRLSHSPSELSGGEQQRVAIARALVTDPPLVIADEPTGELDTETGAQVLDRFQAVAEETAIVIASHDQPTLSIADRVVSLRDGKRLDQQADSDRAVDNQSETDSTVTATTDSIATNGSPESGPDQ